MKNKNVYFIISIIFIFFLWHIITYFKWINPYFLPKPIDIFYSTQDLFEKGYLKDILISTARILISFLISFLLALPTALLIVEIKWISKLIKPYIYFFRYLPVPSLIPLFILILGIGEETKIGLLFMGTFFQFVILLMDDFNEIPTEYFDIAYTLQLKKKDIIHLKIAAILPQIYNNSRVSISICWTYLIIAELVASENGIGYILKEAQRFSNTPIIFVGIITIGIIGFMTDYLFAYFYPKLFKYKINKN